MSCDAIAASALLWLASADPSAVPPRAVFVSAPAAPAAPSSVAGEPLFRDIVQRAGALKVTVEAWRGQTGPLPGLDLFRNQLTELSALDMRGHLLLARRGTDGDLKCILRGISQDLPVRLKEVETAADGHARDQALKEMIWLLRDNVEVIEAPPTVSSGT